MKEIDQKMTSPSEMMIDFLKRHENEMIQNWLDDIVISDTDKHKEEVERNARRMFHLVIRAVERPLTEEEMLFLANKTAQERVDADVNISEFVYNVNIGKSTIIKWLNHSFMEHGGFQPKLDFVNELFDRFSYLAVRRYTEIKDQVLKEKELYIDQTHKERLTILGQMSSSFVHEFRNPLTSIVGFMKLLRNDYPDLPYMDIMQHELDQLNYRISQFLHVSRKELIESKQERMSLMSLLEELIEFLYPTLLDGDVSIQSHCSPDVMIVGNKDEIRQVFLNLIMNSIDALQEVQGYRHINVSCEMLQDDVVVTFCNNGPRIEEEKIEAIFEPFFTTKDLGTGIGLYICRKLVEKHNGTLTCRSTDEKTTFTIRIPVESTVFQP
jgi:signal transduction histidine kinase